MRGLNISGSLAVGVVALMAAGSCKAAAEERNQDFSALEQAVLDGKDFRMVIDMAACQVHGTDDSGPPIKGSIRFDAYMVQGDHTVAFSATHLTVKPDKTMVSEFLSYRVHPTGKVDVRTVVLNPVTDATLQETAFDCEIGKGVSFHW